MNVKERIRKFIDFEKITISAFEKSISAANGYINSISKSIGLDKIEKILDVYPNLNIEWLLMGKGEMLRPVKVKEGASQALEKPRSRYVKAREVNPATCSACEEKERIIKSKDKEIASLERQIEGLKAGFENQIEDLKNNLGMVISEKSEVVKMKDEMLAMKEEAIKGKEATLAAKDETISIQSKRISELESHHEVEDLKKILGPLERIGQESISLTDIHPKDLSTKAKKGEYKV